jgi:hypothetical protein
MEECKRIDRDITRVMAHGMNTIRKLYTSPFSPQVKQARLRQRFYKLHLTMLRNRLDLAAQLSSLAAALDEEIPLQKMSNKLKHCYEQHRNMSELLTKTLPIFERLIWKNKFDNSMMTKRARLQKYENE